MIRAALRVLICVMVLCCAGAVAFTAATLFDFTFKGVTPVVMFAAGMAFSEITRRL